MGQTAGAGTRAAPAQDGREGEPVAPDPGLALRWSGRESGEPDPPPSVLQEHLLVRRGRGPARHRDRVAEAVAVVDVVPELDEAVRGRPGGDVGPVDVDRL